MVLTKQKKNVNCLILFKKRKIYQKKKIYNHILAPFIIFIQIVHFFSVFMQCYHKFFKSIKILLLIFLILYIYIENDILTQNVKQYQQNNKNIFLESRAQTKSISKLRKQVMTFLQFKDKYKKRYINCDEQWFRTIVFEKNKEKINRHNEDQQRTYNMGINQFGDLTQKEFSRLYTNNFKSDEKVKEFSKKISNYQIISHSFQRDQQQNINISLKQELQQISKYVHQQIKMRDDFFSKKDENFFRTNKVFLNENNRVIQNLRYKHTERHPFMHQSHNHRGQSSPSSSFLQSFPFSSSQLNSNRQQKYSLLNQIIAFLLKYNPQFHLKIPSFSHLTSLVPLKQSLNNQTLPVDTNYSSDTNQGNFSQTPIDWTAHAGNVRFQGNCGACYTFATSDTVSSLYSIHKYGFFIPLSTQQVIDCSENGLTYGCDGGFLQGSYAYMQIKGIQTDYNYPYKSEVSLSKEQCKSDGGQFKISSFKNIQEGNCLALVNELNYGPISVGIAGYRLQFYKEGIFSDCNSYIDHAVVLVGYIAGVGWKIKNSWKTEWGINGFAWIADGNNCGICDMAVTAKL